MRFRSLLNVALVTAVACDPGAESASPRADEGANPDAGLNLESSQNAPAIANSAAEVLTLGSSGQRVRDAYDYLVKYGYFPNDELKQRFPDWQPLVESAPEDRSYFDERMEQAVELLQLNMGLEPTAAIDAATTALMAQPRCSFPDGYVPANAADTAHDGGLVRKYHVYDFPHYPTGFSWRVGTLPATFTAAQRAAFPSFVANSVFGVWQSYFDWPVTFVASGSANAVVTFGDVDGLSADTNGDGKCDVRCTAAQAGSNGIFFDKTEPWQVFGDPTPTQIDFRSVGIHEAGHLIGLGHSSYSAAIMYGGYVRGSIKRTLDADDRLAMRAGFGRFQQMLGNSIKLATDLAVTYDGAAWQISNEPRSGGFNIYRRLSTGDWQQVPGGAVNIAVDMYGRAWIVNSVGTIFYRTLDNTAWKTVAGCAKDISVSTGGYIYVNGCGAGDTTVYRSNFTTSNSDAVLDQQRNNGFVSLGGTGVRLAVGGSDIVAVVTSSGDVWLITPFGWSSVSGQMTNPPKMVDVSIGAAADALWAVGTDQRLYALNNQTNAAGATALSRWYRATETSAMGRVAVEGNGRVWVSSPGGLVSRSTK